MRSTAAQSSASRLTGWTGAFSGNSATGTGPYNHTDNHTYNEISNITSYAGNSYTYGSKPHAVTTAHGYENRLTGVSGVSVSATFVYHANGNRVKGTVNSVTTLSTAFMTTKAAPPPSITVAPAARWPSLANELFPHEPPPNPHVRDCVSSRFAHDRTLC